VLATFLAGLGLGAALAAELLKARNARLWFGGIALAALCAVLASAWCMSRLPYWYVELFQAWDLRGNPGAVGRVQGILAAIVLLVPASILGTLLPLAVKLNDDDRPGHRVGMVYLWNTVGSVAGSAVAGFLLVPLAGIRIALMTAVGVIGAGAALAVLPRRALASGVALTALIILVLVPGWDGEVMTSAPYLYGPTYSQSGVDRTVADQGTVLFYRDGISATVTVLESEVGAHRQRRLTVDGKPDGSDTRDLVTQRLIGHLPMMLHPDPARIAVIGLGTGCTGGAVARHPEAAQIDIAEIEPAVVEASAFFRHVNHDVLSDSNVTLHMMDGRLLLKRHPQTYDVIISQPSNPWIAGNADLFTVEYFQVVSSALKDDGLFCQWIQLYSLRPEYVLMLLRGLATVFPEVMVVSTQPGTDLAVLASHHPLRIDLARFQTRFRDVEHDLTLSPMPFRSEWEVLARFRIGPAQIPDLVGTGTLHTDDYPVVAYAAPRDLHLQTGIANRKMFDLAARGISEYLDTGSSERDVALNALADAYERASSRSREATFTRSQIK
jgi:spermidine synthase